MKFKTIFIALSAILIALVSSCSQQSGVKDLSNAYDSVSYIIGTSFAGQIAADANIDTIINSDALVQGVLDILNENEDLLVSQEEGQQFIGQFFQKLKAKQMEDQMSQAEQQFGKNKEIGRKFLEANGAKKGVITTASGLQYKILKNTNGPKPQINSKVKVHYHGTLIDGTVFDSSVERGEPVEFQLTQVIKGWTEALLLMPLGSKFKLFIPEDLAYGANPPSGKIEPFMTLIFEVELLEIN